MALLVVANALLSAPHNVLNLSGGDGARDKLRGQSLTTEALLFYMLKHLGFNQPQGGSLTKQVALKNEAELRALLPATSE